MTKSLEGVSFLVLCTMDCWALSIWQLLPNQLPRSQWDKFKSKDAFLGSLHHEKDSCRCCLLGFVHRGLSGTPNPATPSKSIAKKSMGHFQSKDVFLGSFSFGFVLRVLLGTPPFSTFFIFLAKQSIVLVGEQRLFPTLFPS